MHRRGFLSNIVKAAVVFSILPSASTYARNWVKPIGKDIYVLNPAWIDAPYEIGFLFQNKTWPKNMGNVTRAIICEPSIGHRYNDNREYVPQFVKLN